MKSSSKYNPNFKNQSLTTLQVINSSSFLAGEGLWKKSTKVNTNRLRSVGLESLLRYQRTPRLDTGRGTPPSDHGKKYKFRLIFSFVCYVKFSSFLCCCFPQYLTRHFWSVIALIFLVLTVGGWWVWQLSKRWIFYCNRKLQKKNLPERDTQALAFLNHWVQCILDSLSFSIIMVVTVRRILAMTFYT